MLVTSRLATRIPRRQLVSAYTDSAADGNNHTTYTFAGLSIGTAEPSRLIVAVLKGSLKSSTSARSIDSATIGGSAATEIVQETNDGGGDRGVVGIFSRAMPTGTTTTVVVNFSAAMDNARVDVYSVKSSAGRPPVLIDTDKDTGSGTSAVLAALRVEEYGTAIASVCSANTAGHSWSALFAEDSDVDGDGIGFGSAAAHSFLQVPKTAIACTCTIASSKSFAIVGASWAA